MHFLLLQKKFYFNYNRKININRFVVKLVINQQNFIIFYFILLRFAFCSVGSSSIHFVLLQKFYINW